MKNPETPEIIGVTISNGDVVLFVNGREVYPLESDEKGRCPLNVGENLAEALGVVMQHYAIDEPVEKDWLWPDVYEFLPHPNLDKQPNNDEISTGETGSLVTLDGEEIIGTYEKVWGVAGVISAMRMPDGSLDLENDGETSIIWDTQETEKADGEILFVTASQFCVTQSEVKLVKLAS